MLRTAGQLAIKTIHGRNGAFNVGRLETDLCDAFKVKDAMLEQYKQGKYDGDFIIKRIYPFAYTTGGIIVVEIRAVLDSMILSNIDQLTNDEAVRISPEERDPIDEEAQVPQPAQSSPPALTLVTSDSFSDPLIDTTPFGMGKAANSAGQPEGAAEEDAALFGTLWPLDDRPFKLDMTVDRRTLRRQISRLGQLGYELAPLTQDWHRKMAA